MTLNIGQRILAGFGLIIVLTIGLGVFQIANIGEMRDLAGQIVQTDFRILRLLREVGEGQRDMEILKQQAMVFALEERNKLTDRDSDVAQGQWQLVAQHTGDLLDDLLKFLAQQRTRTGDVDRLSIYAQLEEAAQEKQRLLRDIVKVVRAQFDLVNHDQFAALAPQRAILAGLRDKLSDATHRSEALVAQLSTTAGAAIDNRYQTVSEASALALALVVLVGLASTWLLYSSINRPLRAFMGFVERVGRGDLTQRVTNLGRDEFGRLGQYLNGMVEGLAAAARQSREATVQLTSATAELQASAKQQAASTAEQSAAIQQITATLDEIAQSGAQISERAKSVAAAAEATSATGGIGIDAVTQVSQAMTAIGTQAEAVAANIVALTEKAQSIGEIIAGVNDIAERSDLLALNAAIEAAAAGEGGQSFAVVADEMKNLANQAKESTRQVRTLLGDIQKGISASVMQTEEAVKRAAAGQDRTQQAERTIRNLVESVEESVSTFQQIVAATNQQQIGVEQVAQSIQNIRVASQQMAMGIRGLEQSSVNLGALGDQLRKSMERYEV